ncbi:phosphate transport system substrate-binding protein [Alkalibacillus filiformis]|uniref:Phosphate-binding protein n=1 Tax=Alkalibacillus filiformis TaxID=200990 RepID=A0ABU0DT25_9BACI|nr:phosphate ABC transporter substrate-binding protein [Alkalibacillus filiformis]MDQ0351599.1 phosphate transport system substrate-binding protein [Alkalibacillus filiformis]
MNNVLKKATLLIGFVLLLGLIVGCTQEDDAEPSEENQDVVSASENENDESNQEEGPEGYIRAQGSDTMVNLGQAFAEAYMSEFPGSVAVTGGGSGTGIAALINDDVEIAQASRAFKDEELEEAENNNVDVHQFVVGQDGLAVYTNENNPIDELTVQQVKDIFTGEISDWSELGWDEGGEISVFSRQSNSGTYVYFNENIMDGEDWAAGAQFMSGSAALVEAISQDLNGIGYSGIGYNVDTVNVANVAIDEDHDYVSPLEAENINDGSYPIARPLYFYTNGVPDGLMLHYLNWVIKSDEAQEQLNATGFYGVGNYEEQNEALYEELGLEW